MYRLYSIYPDKTTFYINFSDYNLALRWAEMKKELSPEVTCKIKEIKTNKA